MSKYIPSVGDVVLYNGFPNVVVSMQSYEDYGSCSYDRRYLLCKEEYIKNNQGDIKFSELKRHGEWLSFKGSSFPEIQKIDDIAPYNIDKIDVYSIIQKVAKMVTIYE